MIQEEGRGGKNEEGEGEGEGGDEEQQQSGSVGLTGPFFLRLISLEQEKSSFAL